ncbi:MAG: hypothetical protein MJZ37_08255 [Bacilli bacterium]|nr:hypothetical protein [Bacilli bacterium]
MKEPQINFKYVYKGLRYYTIENDIVCEWRACKRQATPKDFKRWREEFNSRYYQNKYLIAAYSVKDELCIGVWNNINEMAEETGKKYNSIARILEYKIEEEMRITKVNGVRCKLYRVPVYDEEGEKL